ncbi:hypothetical protein IV38_GL001489 [Lactobacillus selangorensis]|uniref:Uncharacterized protein n=1 Tax=Lactobacillus selangorensis TaxID=81857 RepID=A0A0R2FU98_9LACO|nr:hypothetical protein [Lactobacillus selangorensis]KRN28487.1 hypothetical protein IV38_GL001489 [Lactobacillus selangorensis]KRN31987.1 hypothetical protein IV40_GL001275 [Lactobacillus selangorensis]
MGFLLLGILFIFALFTLGPIALVAVAVIGGLMLFVGALRFLFVPAVIVFLVIALMNHSGHNQRRRDRRAYRSERHNNQSGQRRPRKELHNVKVDDDHSSWSDF